MLLNIKNVFIVLLAVSLLFSMSCVYAFDNDEINIDTDNDDVLETSNDDAKTLDELAEKIQNANPGDVINLNNDYYCSESNLTNGIYIFDNVTINGQGHFFDGNGSNMSNLFVAYGDNIVLQNINFINWNLDDSDGIILWGGNYGTIKNCNFINNPIFGGELIDWIGSQGSMYDSNFLNNSVNYGSIIYWKANYGIISNCNFEKNSAENGGAIIWSGREGIIKNTNFHDNSADKGGAVYWDGISGQLIDNKFINNQANYGGAVFCDVSGLNISNCVFKKNNASSEAGAVHLSGGDAEIHDSEFTDNNADYGGAIFIEEYTILSVFDSSFSRNNADYGGAILAEGELYIYDSIFSDNTATKIGGAIYNDFYLSIINSPFINNVADNGGAISVDYGEIINSTFSNNDAIISGGALFVTDELTITNCTFEKNMAGDGSNTIAADNTDSVIIDNQTAYGDDILNLTEVYIDVSDIEYGDTLNMTITVFAENNTFDGKTVNITLNNKKYTAKITNNTANISFPNLDAGNYSGYVIFSDYPQYCGGDSYNFIVNKLDAKLFPYYSPIVGVNSFLLAATIDPSNATGKVVFSVNGTNYTANVNNGIASIIVRNLTPGLYLIPLYYSGDSIYDYSEDIIIFGVEEYYAVITAPDVEKYYGGPERFAVLLTDNNASPIANASVKININGVDYTRVTDSKGIASIALGLVGGIYEVTTEFNSSKAYSEVKIKNTIEGYDITKIFRNGTQYYAKFVDTSGKTLANNTAVIFNINGVMYTRYTNAFGIARLNINLNPGTYIVTAANPKSGESYSNTITVLPSIVENNDLVKYYKNNSQYYIRILDNEGNPAGANVSVSFNINGVFYTRLTNASGYVKLNINLNPGDYIITAEYNGLKVSNKIKVLPTLVAKDLSMKYRDGSKFEVKVLDGTGKALANASVNLNINGVLYTRVSDGNGIARLNINLMPGQYIITSSYNSLSIANKITISG